MPVESLDLTVRSSNCLNSNHIETVGQLVQMTEADLLKIRSFGKTSLREVRRKLADLGLSLGMTDVDKYVKKK
jgi:DNA-directed RNA polymerase subunit alpha